MCLCTESRKRGISFIDFARSVGAPTRALDEWEKKTPCYCASIDHNMIKEAYRMLEVWFVCLEQEEIRRRGGSQPSP